MEQEKWCVVLAAGDGTRLQSVTKALYGHSLPKQFACLAGDRSLLQATVERFSSIAPPSRTIVVVAEEWEQLARRQLVGTPDIHVVTQPMNLGTGPGILLPLAYVRARAASNAMVVVTPSDHHFENTLAVHEAIETAFEALAGDRRHLALIGATSDRPCPDLGWIVTSEDLGRSDGTRRIRQFVEKPCEPVAEQLRCEGALWNTFVMVGSVEAFWQKARVCLPKQTHAFERHVDAIPRGARHDARDRAALRALYDELDTANFSKDVLEQTEDLLVVPLSESGWSDWGTPESIFESLKGTPQLDVLQRRMTEGMRSLAAE